MIRLSEQDKDIANRLASRVIVNNLSLGEFAFDGTDIIVRPTESDNIQYILNEDNDYIFFDCIHKVLSKDPLQREQAEHEAMMIYFVLYHICDKDKEKTDLIFNSNSWHDIGIACAKYILDLIAKT